MKKVSYLVINYNGAKFLDACIKSILDQTWPEGPEGPDKEILICDNDSQDDSEDVCARYPVRFINLGENLGISGAANRGAKKAEGDYLFLLNADIKLEPNCTQVLLEALENNPDAFCADPTQYDWQGQRIIHGRTCFERTSIRSAEIGSYKVRYDGAADDIAPVPWGCAGCMLMEREKFSELGGFDEKFFLEWEDADICWRAWRKGHPTLHVPAALVYHYVGFSRDDELEKLNVKSAPMDARRQASYYENLLRFAIKCTDTGTAIFTALRLSALLPFYIILRPSTGLVIATAIINVIKDMGSLINQRREINQSAKMTPKDIINKFLS